jgi:S1-C subfamily serine protease
MVFFEVKARVTTVSDEWIELREQPGAPSLGGHSGSPLIDMTGGVVGIFVAHVTGVGGIASAIPIWDAETACPRP